jgi:hypothetical protein
VHVLPFPYVACRHVKTRVQGIRFEMVVATSCISTFRKAEVTQLLPATHFGSLFHISDIHVPSDTRHMPILYSSIECQIPVKYPSNARQIAFSSFLRNTASRTFL